MLQTPMDRSASAFASDTRLAVDPLIEVDNLRTLRVEKG